MLFPILFWISIPASLVCSVIGVLKNNHWLVLTGAVVTETIFAWPGVGRLLVSSASARDLPVVQAAILFVAITIVVSNFAVDLIHAAIDPRIDVLGGGTRR